MNEQMKNTPRLLLTAPASGSGKTLITCALLTALSRRGLSLSSFKCGPDYIDPMFHSQVLGTRSANLDSFFAGEDLLCRLLAEGAKGSDLSILEGAMGYYDGLGGVSIRASAYEIASLTKTPAVLIVNSRGMSLSLAALISGFTAFQENSMIRGVIFNRMSPMLYPRMKESIENRLGLPVYGYLPERKEAILESRHLGLKRPGEILGLREMLEALAGQLEESLEIDALIDLARSAPPLPAGEERKTSEERKRTEGKMAGSRLPRIGVARDEAFCFTYAENISLLSSMGAELIPFSPLREDALPEDLDGLYLPGGYPELLAEALSKKRSLWADLRGAFASGLPLIAECGGFMVLHEQMEGEDGQLYPMAGLIPGTVRKRDHLVRFGYISLSAEHPPFGMKDLQGIPAHEFHYFDSDANGEDFLARKPLSDRQFRCMHAGDHYLLGFPHLYWPACPQLIGAFLEKACHFQEKREKGKRPCDF